MDTLAAVRAITRRMGVLVSIIPAGIIVNTGISTRAGANAVRFFIERAWRYMDSRMTMGTGADLDVRFMKFAMAQVDVAMPVRTTAMRDIIPVITAGSQMDAVSSIAAVADTIVVMMFIIRTVS